MYEYLFFICLCMYVCMYVRYVYIGMYIHTCRQTDRQTDTDSSVCIYLFSGRQTVSLEAGFTAMDLRVYAFGVHNAEATKIEGRYNDSSRIYLVSCAIVCSSIPGNF